MMITRTWIGNRLIFLAVFLLVPSLWAGEMDLTKPGAKDKCPVCGMFVAKYPNWAASVHFKDGAAVFFDGPKDMFKFCLSPGKYISGKTTADIGDVQVMEYYTVSPMDGRKAWYVAGSDVFGPMGKELIPFAGEVDAREFLKDHKGRKILRFSEISGEVLKSLE